jgi:hypothetical protein
MSRRKARLALINKMLKELRVEYPTLSIRAIRRHTGYTLLDAYFYVSGGSLVQSTGFLLWGEDEQKIHIDCPDPSDSGDDSNSPLLIDVFDQGMTSSATLLVAKYQEEIFKLFGETKWRFLNRSLNEEELAVHSAAEVLTQAFGDRAAQA